MQSVWFHTVLWFRELPIGKRCFRKSVGLRLAVHGGFGAFL